MILVAPLQFSCLSNALQVSKYVYVISLCNFLAMFPLMEYL